MFNLFKRKQLNQWEKDLLINIFDILSNEFVHYKEQIQAGLLKRVRLSNNFVPNEVNFSYNPTIAEKFRERNGRHFCIQGIRVFDKKKREWSEIILYFSHGLIISYSTPQNDNFAPDISKVLIISLRKVYLDTSPYNIIKKLFNEFEQKLINPADFYEIEIKGKVYYHIKDIGDGDFIGVDEQKKIYKITHDPFEIKLQTDNLSNLIQNL